MSELSKNSFFQGLDQDQSKSKYSPEKYLDATNFRVLTDRGLSSYSLENIKGTLALSGGSLLDLPIVQKISFDNTATGGNIQIAFTDGVFTDPGAPFNTVGKTPEDLYDFISTSLGYSNFNIQYKIYYNDLYLLVVPITTNTPFTISDTAALGNSTIDSTFIPAQTNLEVIGSTFINDDIYLFTTNNTQTAPTTSYGQIWKLVINDVTNVATLTNIYNNQINFSTYNAIAPTAALGRYENTSIQRIYWTDNYNKLRSLNVTDPQVFALDPSLIDVVPAADFDIPIMQTINNVGGSNVPVGIVQVAYRLKNTTGAVTTFSRLSNPVYIVPSDEAANVNGAGFKDYIGAIEGTNTTKQISWKIDNLDQNFERIEIVVVTRSNQDDSGSYDIIYDQPIDGDSFSFIYNGNQLSLSTSITIDEFLALSGVFTHCKTITSKDNRLIAGNVRTEQAEIDFDVRAYQFPISSTTFQITEDGIIGTYDNTNWQTIDDNSDAINTNTTTQRYKENSTTLGGSGINVSYEFQTVAIAADRVATGQVNFNIADTVGAPWRQTNPRYDATSLELNVVSPTNITGVSAVQTYPKPVPDINDGFKYPHINGFYRGYQRNETYRFGIQFYDKAGNPYFVKWIGDIKFPDFDDTNPNSFYENGTATPHSDFRLSFVANVVGYDECFVNSLGILFTINNLETISDQISGYSIVRVEREVKDKTIVAQGYVTPVDETGGQFYTTSPRTDSSGNLIVGGLLPVYQTRGFFITPEISHLAITPDNTMEFKVKSRLGTRNTDVSILNTGGGQPYYMYKLYDWNTGTSQTTRNIEQITLLQYGGNGIDDFSSTDVFNYDYGQGADPVTTSQSIGNTAFYFRLDGVLTWPGATEGKLLCNIERTLSSQYGGNTYENKANNEYIYCGHYRPIRTTSVPIIDFFQFFGGDTFINMYDSCRWAKNFGNFTSRGLASVRYSTTFYFPVESTINTDLRHGTYMNRSFTGGVNYEAEIKETYEYNSVYSAENTVNKYFPKPDPFIPVTEFNNRFHISEIKINGELQDSWAVFKSLNYWDVDGTQGAITACDILQDQVYFAQDRAFGKLRINPRVAITSQDGDQIQIGKGTILDGHDYISTETGTKHQFSFLKSAYQIFLWDARHNKIFSFNPSTPLTPISDIKGMHSWLQLNAKNILLTTDKPVYEDPTFGINGLHGVYDYVNNELYYTFLQSDSVLQTPKKFTLVYNEKLGVFTSFYSHTPKIYITNHKKIISPNPTNSSTYKNLFLHNYGLYGNFYGTFYDSMIECLINKYPEVTKVFDNLIMQTEVQTFDATTNSFIDTSSVTPFTQETFNSIECKTDYQTSGIIPLNNTNLVRRFRTWRTQIPRSNVQAANMSTGFFSRLRDKYLRLKLKFLNNSDKRLIVHDLVSSFRINVPR